MTLFILLPSNRSPLLDHVVDLFDCVVVKYLVPMAAYYITVLYCSVHMLCFVLYTCYAVVWDQGSCSLMCGSDACCLPSLSTSCWQDRVLGKTCGLILFISATTHCRLFWVTFAVDCFSDASDALGGSVI
jgi:hypothetical protein